MNGERGGRLLLWLINGAGRAYGQQRLDFSHDFSAEPSRIIPRPISEDAVIGRAAPEERAPKSRPPSSGSLSRSALSVLLLNRRTLPFFFFYLLSIRIHKSRVADSRECKRCDDGSKSFCSFWIFFILFNDVEECLTFLNIYHYCIGTKM